MEIRSCGWIEIDSKDVPAMLAKGSADGASSSKEPPKEEALFTLVVLSLPQPQGEQ